LASIEAESAGHYPDEPRMSGDLTIPKRYTMLSRTEPYRRSSGTIEDLYRGRDMHWISEQGHPSFWERSGTLTSPIKWSASVQTSLVA
jgi:hypothetical protein